MKHLRTILWGNPAENNHDCCSLFQIQNGFQLQGMAILLANNLPMRVAYRIACTSEWKTQLVELDVWKGNSQQLFMLRVDEQQRWWLDDTELSQFRGLIDVDLGFTPATNTLPIRRMQRNDENSNIVTAVWVQFPSLEIMPLRQRYTRLSSNKYFYESFETQFQAKIQVDALGMVTHYETLWYQIASAD